MMFHDVTFPKDIAIGAQISHKRKTDVVTFVSGKENRNSRWKQSKRIFDAGYGVTDFKKLNKVIDFFNARSGALYGFRFTDPLDYSSSNNQSLHNMGVNLQKPLPALPITALDQKIGLGDGVTAEFYLKKTYGEEPYTYEKIITHAQWDSVKIAINGVATEDFTINIDQDDNFKGKIVFNQNAIPAAGAEITAGFYFDVPVRFLSDRIDVNLTHFYAGEIPSIPLIELLDFS